MSFIKVLLVDDHTVVREGLKRILEMDGGVKVVGEAASGEEAVEQASLLAPDIAIMDIRMPGMGGVEAIRTLKECCPGVNVIALTVYGDQYLTQVIEAGAEGYLLKDVGRDELVQAIHAVYGGQSVLHSAVSRELFTEFATLAKGKDGNRFSLSPREKQMLHLIASGVTNKEIAANLCYSETTVKRQIRSIFDKLGVNDRAEAVSEALRKGLM